jgi:hypothetical protein
LVGGDTQVTTDEDEALSYNEAINYLKDFDTEPKPVNVEKSPPFAEPLFRTKRDSSAEGTCDKNDSVTIDYRLLVEKYCAGGFLVIKNAQFKDWVKAQVYDKDEVIPEPYREALCENWPVVAEYITKEWIKFKGDEHTIHEIKTKPLNAKISAGLYLRVVYNASDSGIQREIITTYDLTVKL